MATFRDRRPRESLNPASSELVISLSVRRPSRGRASGEGTRGLAARSRWPSAPVPRPRPPTWSSSTICLHLVGRNLTAVDVGARELIERLGRAHPSGYRGSRGRGRYPRGGRPAPGRLEHAIQVRTEDQQLSLSSALCRERPLRNPQPDRCGIDAELVGDLSHRQPWIVVEVVRAEIRHGARRSLEFPSNAIGTIALSYLRASTYAAEDAPQGSCMPPDVAAPQRSAPDDPAAC